MRTIIIIDDNEIDLLIARKILERHLFEIEILCFSSVETLLSEIGFGKFYEAILLVDLEMPIVDGWTLLKKLSEIKYTGAIYILTVIPETLIKMDNTTWGVIKQIFCKPLSQTSVFTIANENGIPYTEGSA